MGGLYCPMIGLAIVDVPEQQRHPTFALAALGGAVWPKGRFGLANAVEAAHGGMARHLSKRMSSPKLGEHVYTVYLFTSIPPASENATALIRYA